MKEIQYPRSFIEFNRINPMRAYETQRGWVLREAWKKVIRRDLCAYCGRSGGTVDHIVPRSKRRKKNSIWLDYTGACYDCNHEKKNDHMLLFLLKQAKRRDRRLR